MSCPTERSTFVADSPAMPAPTTPILTLRVSRRTRRPVAANSRFHPPKRANTASFRLALILLGYRIRKGRFMTVIGFHCSHEQISPARLLRDVQHAEQAGFAAAMSSDHFTPWRARQGESGFAWSFLGAA